MLSQPSRTEASLRQGVPSVLFAACEVPFGRCVFTREPWPLALLAAECGRRLAAPPGRSSSLRCGRSTWTCGCAGGRVAVQVGAPEENLELMGHRASTALRDGAQLVVFPELALSGYLVDQVTAERVAEPLDGYALDRMVGHCL
jgi:hypothetical protein